MNYLMVLRATKYILFFVGGIFISEIEVNETFQNKNFNFDKGIVVAKIADDQTKAKRFPSLINPLISSVEVTEKSNLL